LTTRSANFAAADSSSSQIASTDCIKKSSTSLLKDFINIGGSSSTSAKNQLIVAAL
jgi:hypothetical protein